MKWVLRVFKYTAIGFMGLLAALLGVAYIQDRFFYHPLSPTAVKDLFGQEDVQLTLQHRIDFIGIDIHGDIFDYHQYSLDSAAVNRFIRQGKFSQYPLFEDSLYQGKRQVSPFAISKWKQTPLITQEDQTYMRILSFGNLEEYRSSRAFLQADYLTKPGSYYAYYSAFPAGNYVYVLVPGKSTLYLVRKKG